MIHVIATIQLKAGAQQSFLEVFRALMPAVHAEDGCIEYLPATDVATSIEVQATPRTDCVTVIEKWESVDHLRAHLDADHMHRFREDVAETVESLSIQVLESQG